MKTTFKACTRDYQNLLYFCNYGEFYLQKNKKRVLSEDTLSFNKNVYIYL